MDISQKIQKLYEQTGISPEVYDFGEKIEKSLKERFDKIDKMAELNQLKVIHAMQEARVNAECFNYASGYGYNDFGRDTLEKVYANVFHTEDALVRPQITCGTHALALTLSANLRPGDELLSIAGKPVEEALPIGTVITISAAGSEGSPDSVITKEEGMFKRGATGEAFRPKFTIMNPALTQTLPAYQTACGITDIMAHLYERYLTNTEEVEVTDRMIEGLLLTMIHEGPRVIADPDNYQARANIMWAGMMAHNNSCGVGRTQDWTSHNIEHELSALYDCAHGAGLAVVMPAVFTYTLEHNVMRFAQAAVRVWGCQMDFADPKRTALEGIEALRNFLISIGMPKNFAELGAKEEDIEKLAHTCCYGDVNTGTVEGFATLDQKDVENIYKLMVF